MPNFLLPPLTSVNLATPGDTLKSIHILFMQGDGKFVIDWLNTLQTPADEELLGYVWSQSIKSNASGPMAVWLREHHPEKMDALNAKLNIVKLLHSPRAWEGLKAQNLMPALNYEAIVNIVAVWNKRIIGVTKLRSTSPAAHKKMEPY